MVNASYRCPVCELSEPVVRFGFTPVGNQRLRCQKCRKTWTPHARSRQLSPEKEALIETALQERLSQRAIVRTFKVARTTIRDLTVCVRYLEDLQRRLGIVIEGHNQLRIKQIERMLKSTL